MNQDLLTTLQIETRVQIPTAYGPADFITFRGFADNKEHFAIQFTGASSHRKMKSSLVRVHSECITGDLFASEKCDCGDQLDEAMQLISKRGGVLLYLRQEGRGIGLREKLRAYRLQAQGLDTFEANRALGHKDDLRQFFVAGQMLKALNVDDIILITNNPQKELDLLNQGIKVSAVQSTRTYLKPSNRKYLEAKKQYSGHRLSLDSFSIPQSILQGVKLA
jgi:GTP cyclohydrolase II